MAVTWPLGPLTTLLQSVEALNELNTRLTALQEAVSALQTGDGSVEDLDALLTALRADHDALEAATAAHSGSSDGLAAHMQPPDGDTADVMAYWLQLRQMSRAAGNRFGVDLRGADQQTRAVAAIVASTFAMLLKMLVDKGVITQADITTVWQQARDTPWTPEKPEPDRPN